MESIIKELWHGNILPQDDSRNNSPEMKKLIEYMSRHHDDLVKTMTDEQKSCSSSLTTAGASTRAWLKKRYSPMRSSSA